MENLRDFLDSVGYATWNYDLVSHKLVYISDIYEGIYGIPVKDIKEHPELWRKYVHPEDYLFVDSETSKVFKGEVIELEYRILVDGTMRWIHEKKAPVFNKKGELTGMAGITSDITSKKESELKLVNSEQTFRYLFTNNPNPLWIYDLETLKFLAVNHAAVVEYGYSESEFLTMTIADIRPPEDIQKLITKVRNVKEEYSHSEGWRHIRKDGSVIYVNISGHGIEYEGRKAELVMAHDITAQVKSREEIVLAKTNLDALINNIKDLIWSVDRNYCLLSANVSFLNLNFKVFDRKFKPGDSVLDASSSNNDTVRLWKGYYDKVLAGEDVVFNNTVRIIGITYEIRMRPIMHEGKIIGVVCLGRDIHRRLNAEKKVLKQNAELKEIVSLASHEIRGPVASLMGLVGLFNRKDLADPFNADIINHVKSTVEQLDGVIHKIVDKSYSIQLGNESDYSSQQNLLDYE